jgi:putative protease
MRNSGIEVMAPVGSYEALAAAIHAGCDSIYFGVEQLNMRSRSSINFNTDDLAEIMRRCNAENVKAYLTINTVLYDHDIRLMKTIVDHAVENGVSAIIASDHAVMAYCKEVGMPVHVSTQANISNIETVAFYAVFADVMVMARELSLRQVADITREIERRQIKGPSGELIRVEVFAHGALCMAVSGKCYLSLHSHNASANRGACIQNCRRKYVVIDKDEGVEFEIDNEYIMSAKDLCTIPFIDKVIEAGVQVLKIEGRGRAADYVDTTVSCYKEAVESIQQKTFTKDKIEDWLSRLSKVYNRGFWDGYYLGRKMGEWNDSYGSKATEKKVFIGRGVKYFSRIKIGEFQMESYALQKGDQIMITGPTTGIVRTTAEELRVDDKNVDVVQKGDVFSLPVAETIRPSDKLYKIVEA